MGRLEKLPAQVQENNKQAKQVLGVSEPKRSLIDLF